MAIRVEVQDDFHGTDGTHLIGHINESYETLVSLFGEPMEGCDKTDAEWVIRFYDEEEDQDIVATIYNWKDGYNYCGGSGLPVESITEWHIGGFDSRSHDLVTKVIDAYKVKGIGTSPIKLID